MFPCDLSECSAALRLPPSGHPEQCYGLASLETYTAGASYGGSSLASPRMLVRMTCEA